MHAYGPVAVSVLDRDAVLDSLSPDNIQRHANIINNTLTSHTFEHQHGLIFVLVSQCFLFLGRDYRIINYFSSSSWGDKLSGF